MLGGLASVGVNVAVIRLVPEYREQDRLALVPGVTFGSNLAAFSVGTCLALAGAAGLWLFEPYGLGRRQAWMGLALIPP